MDRYREKLPESLSSLDSRSLCAAFLNAIGVDKTEYAIGVTHVWFKAGKLPFSICIDLQSRPLWVVSGTLWKLGWVS